VQYKVVVKMTTEIIKKLLDVTYSFLKKRYSNQELKQISNELKTVVDFNCEDYLDVKFKDTSYEEMQNILSKLNEKESKQKKNGVYYTPSDLVRFIYTNTVKSYYGIANSNNLHVLDLNGVPYESFCFEKTVFDILFTCLIQLHDAPIANIAA